MPSEKRPSSASQLTCSLALRVAHQAHEAIVRGQFGRPGDRFLTVRQLADRFDISLVTAQRALEALKQQHVLLADSTRPAIIHPDLKPTGDASPAAPTYRLGMIVTNLASPFFSQLAHHVQTLASQIGWQVLLASSDYDPAREQRIIDGFLDIHVQAILAAPGLGQASTAIYQRLLQQTDTRLVFVSRRIESLPVDSVVVHNMLGAAKVADHLWQQGHRRFGFIGFRSDIEQEPRLMGYRAALHARGVELADDQIAYAEDWHPEAGCRAMAQLMNAPTPPTAVFAYHDLLALGALHHCRQHQLRVPHDVALVGFDDLPESRVTTPALSTVSYPLRSMAELSIQMAQQPLDRSPDRQPHTVLLEPALIVRSSSDPDVHSNPLDIAVRIQSDGRHLVAAHA
ncbi:MAG: substrate-binding domain-containing protein [Phycisphaerales bacterium]